MNDTDQQPAASLIPTESYEVINLGVDLTVALNDYSEERLEHDVILTEAEDVGHRIVFSCPPGVAALFPVGAVIQTTIQMRGIS